MNAEGTREHAFGGGRAAGGGESRRGRAGGGSPRQTGMTMGMGAFAGGVMAGTAIGALGQGVSLSAGAAGAGIGGSIAMDIISGVPGLSGTRTTESPGRPPTAAPNTAANTRATPNAVDQVGKGPGVAQEIENVRPPTGPDLRLAMINTGGGTPVSPMPMMVAADPASGAAAVGGALIVASYPVVQQLVKLTMQGAVKLWKWIHEAAKDTPVQRDVTGKLHGDVPDHVPDDWTEQQRRDAADEVRKSIDRRKQEQVDMGEDPDHRARINEEERFWRQLQKSLEGSHGE